MEYKRIKDVDLQASVGTRVFCVFLALDVQVKYQKDNVTRYISFNMCDVGVKINIKKFNATASDIEQIKSGCVYQGAIDVKDYMGSASCLLYNYENSDINPSAFVEWTQGLEEAHIIIKEALLSISDTTYGKLVYQIIGNKWDKFCYWTAASSVHHSALGGLVVHTSEVLKQSELLASYWKNMYGEKFINMPLLISAAILHDIGKVHELDVDMTSGETSYSGLASLETHITMCVSEIDIEAFKLGIGCESEGKDETTLSNEKEDIRLLKHCILSHHGKLEYGSPITPHTPEAVIINIADNLSAEMYRYNKEMCKLNVSESASNWISGTIAVVYKDYTK
jgi:3'-5' exoribonuclease